MNRTFFTAVCVIVMSAGFVSADQADGSRELVWQDGKWVGIAAPQEGTPEGELSLIRLHHDRKQYKAALKQAKKFLNNYPADRRGEEVLCLMGQCEMGLGNYFDAFELFEKQINKYPNGPLLERALEREFQIADAYCKGRKKKALKIFKFNAEEEGLDILAGIANKVPGTVLAEKVSLYVADFYYSKEDYDLAVESYDYFLKDFGNSKKAGYATLQAARASYNQYKGEKFDDTPLVDAYERYSDYLKKYPAQAEKNGVEGVLKNLLEKINKRTWTTAEFYRRVGRKKAAAFYYRRIITQAPSSRWQEKAEKALAELGE